MLAVPEAVTGSGSKWQRLALRGGSCLDGGGAGLFALSLGGSRSRRGSPVGFRPAFFL